MFQGTETIENELPTSNEGDTQSEIKEEPLTSEENTDSDEQVNAETEQPLSPEDVQEGSQKDYRERSRYQRKLETYKQKNQQIEEVAKKLAEENLVLRQYVDGYGQAASHHYSEKLKLKINQTQQKLEEAEANDDIKAKTEAIRELTKLAEEEAYLERYNYKNSQSHEQNKQQEQRQPTNATQPQPEEAELPEEVEDWFDEHPWLDQRRQEFNSEIRDEIYAYSQTLARRWKRAGKENQIDSPVFLDEVGKYAKDNFPEYYSPTDRRPPLNNHRGVSQPPVKKQPTTQTAPRFTPAEREMMQHFGMTEKEWLESKKDVEKRSRGIN